MLRTQLRAIVAGWIAAGLDERRLGIEELAEMAGLTRETIWKLRTERVDATDDTLDAIARALKLPLPELTVRDGAGTADYRAGVRATTKAVRQRLDEIERTTLRPTGDGDGRHDSERVKRAKERRAKQSGPSRRHGQGGQP